MRAPSRNRSVEPRALESRVRHGVILAGLLVLGASAMGVCPAAAADSQSGSTQTTSTQATPAAKSSATSNKASGAVVKSAPAATGTAVKPAATTSSVAKPAASSGATAKPAVTSGAASKPAVTSGTPAKPASSEATAKPVAVPAKPAAAPAKPAPATKGAKVSTTGGIASGKTDSKPAGSAIVQSSANLDEQVSYQYNALGRRDPFQSLLTGEYVGADVGGDAPPDVGGLKVVGIVWGDADQFALVEDGRGDSHILRRGDKVTNGYVEALKRDAMIVNLTVDGQSQSVTIPLTRKGEKINANR